MVLSFHKLTPPIMEALLNAGETEISGIICPGHVSTIIGSHPYEFIPRKYGIGCVVTGFEVIDILLGVNMLVKQVEKGKPDVEIAYQRAVRPEGNIKALELIDQVFEVSEAVWRGVGVVPESGLKLRDKYGNFDAGRFFDIPLSESIEPVGCICGEILRGLKTPSECGLFQRVCTPENPVGPCMVSGEGACAAYNLYGEMNG